MNTTWDVFSHGKTEHGEHVCYWCAAGGYPPMPVGYTLCVRCGTFMHTGIEDDPMNDRMEVCILCRQAMEHEE